MNINARKYRYPVESYKEIEQHSKKNILKCVKNNKTDIKDDSESKKIFIKPKLPSNKPVNHLITKEQINEYLFDSDILINDIKYLNPLSLFPNDNKRSNESVVYKKIFSSQDLNSKLKLLIKNFINLNYIKFIKLRILSGDIKLANYLITLDKKYIETNKEKIEKYIQDIISIRDIELWEENSNFKNITDQIIN